MEDKTISSLTEQTVLSNNDEFPFVRNENGTYFNYKVKKSNLTSSVPDATSTITGGIRLTGDLSGTSLNPTVPGLNLKANLASPQFTGNPLAPTPTNGDNSTKLATTAFVTSAISSYAANFNIPNATSLQKGVLQLTGDLGGTATSPTVPGLTSKANISSLSTVAFSGSYIDLNNKPNIPTLVSQLTNDANYLTITTGSLLTALGAKQNNLGYTPENVANKNVSNGYVGLNNNGLISSTLLPSYVDDVLEFANLVSFPVTGESSKIYISLENNKQYRWSGSTYIEIVSSPGTTDSIVEGSNNLYFSNARVVNAPLTGYTTQTGSVSSSDTILSSIGKLQNSVNQKQDTLTFTPEDVSNKSIDTNLGTSDTLYSSQNAIKTYVDNIAATKVNTSNLATVATSGSYNDLINKPTIPNLTSQLTNDSNYITQSVLTTSLGSKANLSSPTFSGTPLSPTPTQGDSSLKVATTEFVNVAISNAVFNSSQITIPDASTATKGIIQLTGDLGGTATSPTVPGLASKVNISSLSNVATSGSYIDLTNKPSIPTLTSQLTNDSGFITTNLVTSVAGKTGAITLTKTDVGLNNVDNTSDLSKPISTATQAALDLKQNSLGFTAEDVSNKSTTTTLGTSNALYPTQGAVKTYVDTNLNGVAKTNVINSFSAVQYSAPIINNSATGTVILDGGMSNIFILTLTGNLTLSMNNVQSGATYIIYLIEDSIGGSIITLNSIFKRLVGDTTTFNTSANRVNVLTGIARASNAITLFPIAVEIL